jgi:hypothetical protein
MWEGHSVPRWCFGEGKEKSRRRDCASHIEEGETQTRKQEFTTKYTKDTKYRKT